MHVQTAAGFEWDMDPDVMDDILVIEDLAALDQGDLLKVPEVLRRLLGETGKQALYEHLKTEEGRVPISAVSAALAEIITALGDSGKNNGPRQNDLRGSRCADL